MPAREVEYKKPGMAVVAGRMDTNVFIHKGREEREMETWMIVTAVIVATVIVFLLGALQKWFRKSRVVREVKSGVQSVQAFREKYPTPKEYEVDVVRELLVQGAEESLLKQVLKEAYDITIAQSHKSGEEPAHFVDRWLYSIAAPKRWDFMEGVLPYYFQVVQVLLVHELRPTPVIKRCGGKQPFIQIVESEFIRGTSPDELVSKYFRT